MDESNNSELTFTKTKPMKVVPKYSKEVLTTKIKEKKEKLYFDNLINVKSSFKSEYKKLINQRNFNFQNNKEELSTTLAKMTTSKIILDTENPNLNNNQKNNENFIKKDTQVKSNKSIITHLTPTNRFNISNSNNKTQFSTTTHKNYYQTPSSTEKTPFMPSAGPIKTYKQTLLNSPPLATNYNQNPSVMKKFETEEKSFRLSSHNSFIKNDLKYRYEEIQIHSETVNDIYKSTGKFVKNEFCENSNSFKLAALRKYNTDFKKVIRPGTNKRMQKLLTDRDFNSIFSDNKGKINNVNEFKQYIQKNQFDKELLSTIKKRHSLYNKK